MRKNQQGSIIVVIVVIIMIAVIATSMYVHASSKRKPIPPLPVNLTPKISNGDAYYKNDGLDTIRQQFTNIGIIRAALIAYEKETGSYPISLNDLSQNTNGKIFLDVVPNDTFTQKPYIYQKTGAQSYLLKYEIQLLKPISDAEVKILVTGTSQGQDGVAVSKPSIYLGFIEGTNTLDQTVEYPSFEAKAQNAIDSDNDGVPNYLEDHMELNKYDPDSNGDEIDDGTEVLRRLGSQSLI